jgi:predicted NBD/HSP70 family sugar kinase
LLELNGGAGVVISVYIAQSVVGALADLSGQILHRRVADTVPGAAGVQHVAEVIDDLCGAATALGRQVLGAAVGAPSIVTQPEGVVVWAPTLGWRGFPLKEHLESTLGMPILVENEANLLVLGERWRGAGQGKRNLVCVSLGTGIGAGLILNDQLYRGAHFAGGEIGYLTPDDKYLGRTYAHFGCLESLAGRNGIIRRTTERLAAGESSLLSAQPSAASAELSVELVFAAARAGDALAQATVAETADYLSLALNNLACILDPEVIVINGELAEFGDLFVATLRQRIGGVLPTMPEIVLSPLGLDAAVLGAVALVVRETGGVAAPRPVLAEAAMQGTAV